MTILDEIFTYKREEVSEKKRHLPLKEMQALSDQAPPALDFLAAISSSPAKPALIAEIKQASPSRGLIAEDFDPLRLARIYQENGAAAISVLTDRRYFMGDLDDLRVIATQKPRLPLFRKDFLWDPYQVYESRAAGADAVLLITAGLTFSQLCQLHDLSHELGMAALMEVHTMQELDLALQLEPDMIGINNRDLSDFHVDLQVTHQLRPHIPRGICVVSESGVHSYRDVMYLMEAGVDAVLVGEALVSAPDIGAQVRALSGVEHNEDKDMRDHYT